MTEWSQLITKALRQLEADQTPARGAALRQQLETLAREHGYDLQAYLTSNGLKFWELVHAVPDVVIRRVHGSDMYVGLDGVEFPDITRIEVAALEKSGIRLRADLYAALTRIGVGRYYYIRSRDEFTSHHSDESPSDTIELPSVTLDTLLDVRRQFAEQQATEASVDLQDSVDQSPNPLAAFQATVSRLGLGRAWHEFNSKRLRDAVESWARSNDVAVSSSWFVEDGAGTSGERPQNLLAGFSRYMTDEEIRSLQVPFRAVEALYRDLARPAKR